MTANEINLECMTGILPWWLLTFIYISKTACTIAIMSYKNVKTIRRRRKTYWTKNGPRWKARLSKDQVISMQQEMTTRREYLSLETTNDADQDESDATSSAFDHGSDLPKLVARTSSSAVTRRGVHRIKFDTDSIKVAIDTGASRSISSKVTDFEGDITPTNQTIDGIANGLSATGKGTIVWNIQDDQGRVHHIRIPNSLYVPASPIRILSPQHWAQEVYDKSPRRRGTWCATYEDGCELFWQQNKYVKTVKHDIRSNVPIMSANNGTKKYRATMAAEQCLLCNALEQSVCYCLVCRNSTHNVLSDTQQGKGSE